MTNRSDPAQNQAGFTYLLLLIALSALAISMLKTLDGANMRHIEQQEAELLFRGEQIQAAIAAYHSKGSGCFPTSFEQLLTDNRGKVPFYPLRHAYNDPITHQPFAKILDVKGRWIGVHSLSTGKPRRKAGFTKDAEVFATAKQYSDWKFRVKDDPLAPLPAACER